jgi:hypothetical protein
MYLRTMLLEVEDSHSAKCLFVLTWQVLLKARADIKHYMLLLLEFMNTYHLTQNVAYDYVAAL